MFASLVRLTFMLCLLSRLLELTATTTGEEVRIQ